MANIEEREASERSSITKAPDDAVARMIAADAYDSTASRNLSDNRGRTEANSNVMKQFGNLEITGQLNQNADNMASTVVKR